MTRLLSENSRRPGRGGGAIAGVDADETPHGRSAASIDDDTAGVRLLRQRKDPAGRRSLTGLEFWRQRSI